VRKFACERLVAHLRLSSSSDPSIGARLVAPCRAHLDAAEQQRFTKARRAVEIEGALARVATASTSREMQLFHARFSITGDPRVEKVRAQAIKRFGPRDPARFIAAREAVEARSFDGYHATLCDADATSAEIAVCHGSVQRFRPISDEDLWATAEHTTERAPAATGCGMGTERSQENFNTLQQERTVERLLGVKIVEVVGTCSGDHWYFEEPLNGGSK
jgi:hypothetical protein